MRGVPSCRRALRVTKKGNELCLFSLIKNNGLKLVDWSSRHQPRAELLLLPNTVSNAFASVIHIPKIVLSLRNSLLSS